MGKKIKKSLTPSTHIRIDVAVKEALDKRKIYKKESYTDLLKRLVLDEEDTK